MAFPNLYIDVINESRTTNKIRRTKPVLPMTSTDFTHAADDRGQVRRLYSHTTRLYLMVI